MNRFLSFITIITIGLATLHAECGKAIVHLGDRIVINIDSLNLRGDETLMDVLMLMPEVMTIDGRTTASDELHEYFVVRINNINIGLDEEQFLRNVRASDLKTVKICMNPGVMKGCTGLKKVIDCQFRDKSPGTSGRVGLEAGSFGNAATFNTLEFNKGKVSVNAWITGQLRNHEDNDTGIRTHSCGEQATAMVECNAGDRDNWKFFVSQTTDRSHTRGTEYTSNSTVITVDGLYVHSFTDAGTYALCQFGAGYSNSNDAGIHAGETDPYMAVEFSTPMFKRHLWLTPGMETGYSWMSNHSVNIVNRLYYCDIYAQLDYTLGKLHLMAGDRVRIAKYWVDNKAFSTVQTNHFYTFSAWYDFNMHHTLQATFARKFFMRDDDEFISPLEPTGYINNLYQPKAYTSELRYTWQTQKVKLCALVRDVNQDMLHNSINSQGWDNTLSAGVSARFSKGIFGITAGATYNWESINLNFDENGQNLTHTQDNHFASLKLIPEIRLKSGWRFRSTLLFNSPRTQNDEILRQVYGLSFTGRGNLYIAFRIDKRLGKGWNIYTDMHDLAQQRTGNREALIGFTYLIFRQHGPAVR